MTTRIRTWSPRMDTGVRAWTPAARQSLQSILGGVSLQSVSTTARNVWRCAPFLKALGTHCISRSGPRPPTLSSFSPAPPLPPRPPAPCHTHTQSRPSGRSIQHHTRTQHPAWASPQPRGARLHRVRVAGNTPEASCCRTRRCRRVKRILRRLPAAADHASVLPRATTPRADPRPLCAPALVPHPRPK
jgi:hypothetical protein